MQKFLKSKELILIILFATLILGLLLRTYGLNWDQNQHLHPDERFLTMVIQAMRWPASPLMYLNPKLSTLNPYNIGYSFYVYGTLPLYLDKFASGLVVINSFDYNNVTLVGRFLSAMFDTATIFLTFLIGKKLFNTKSGLIAAFIYSITVLPIQLSHFFTVDTFLVFFLTLTFYFLITFIEEGKVFLKVTLMGASLGFALACKVSAILIIPVIFVGFVYKLFKERSVLRLLIFGLIFMLSSYFTFRLTDPKSFASANILSPIPNTIFMNNLKQLTAYNTPNSLYPPAIQWISTKPLIFPLKNMLLWGLGIPLGILTIMGLASWFYTYFIQIKKFHFNPLKCFFNIQAKEFAILLSLLWILELFFYQGSQFVKSLRYFYPIYPMLVMPAADLSSRVILKKLRYRSLISTYFALLLVWPFSFISIYTKPHSRITASEWIYKNIPSGSTITCEYWDDCLPLAIGNQNSSIYNTETLTLFDPDNSQKWQKINDQLRSVDYLILSSNRLWGSITKVPIIYPVASKFYEDLLAGKTLPSGEKFVKVAEFTSYPTIPFTNIQIPDQSAEEAFTVYDHPKVMIYKKI